MHHNVDMPVGGGAAEKSRAEAMCTKFGGRLTESKCGLLKSYGYGGDITSADECNQARFGAVKQNTMRVSVVF